MAKPFYYARLESRAHPKDPSKATYSGQMLLAGSGYPHRNDAEILRAWDCESYEDVRTELLAYMEDYNGLDVVFPESMAKFMEGHK